VEWAGSTKSESVLNGGGNFSLAGLSAVNEGHDARWSGPCDPGSLSIAPSLLRPGRFPRSHGPWGNLFRHGQHGLNRGISWWRLRSVSPLPHPFIHSVRQYRAVRWGEDWFDPARKCSYSYRM